MFRHRITSSQPDRRLHRAKELLRSRVPVRKWDGDGREPSETLKAAHIWFWFGPYFYFPHVPCICKGAGGEELLTDATLFPYRQPSARHPWDCVSWFHTNASMLENPQLPVVGFGFFFFSPSRPLQKPFLMDHTCSRAAKVSESQEEGGLGGVPTLPPPHPRPYLLYRVGDHPREQSKGQLHQNKDDLFSVYTVIWNRSFLQPWDMMVFLFPVGIPLETSKEILLGRKRVGTRQVQLQTKQNKTKQKQPTREMQAFLSPSLEARIHPWRKDLQKAGRWARQFILTILPNLASCMYALCYLAQIHFTCL